MKTWNSALFALTVLSFVIVACAPATSTVGGKCDGGVCVSLKISEPVPFNQSVPVTITVETDQDETGLRIGIDSDKRTVVIEGENLWTVDTKSRTPITVTTNIRFTQEGYFPVIAGATRSIGITAIDSIPVHVTRTGVTLNPPSERLPGTPAPAIQIVPCDNPTANPPNMCTPTPGPLQTPPSTGKPQLLNITTRQDVNLAILDSGTWLTYTIPITTAPSGAVVFNIGAKLFINHSCAQDSVVEIVAPDGKTLERVWDHQVPTKDNLIVVGL